jgi:hypothetical protein
MRKDLNKVLCERERHGHDNHYRLSRRDKRFNDMSGEELENLPHREGMKRRHVFDYGRSKQFNENLRPLLGIIRKNVNRPWNKVYAELCQVFDRRSVINQHIVQHLRDFIELDTYVKDGEVWVRSRWGMDSPIKSFSSAEFYVDPRTGLIRLNRHRVTYKQANRLAEQRRKAEDAKVHRVIDETTEAFLVNGVWFIAEMRPTPEGHRVKKSYAFNSRAIYYTTEYPDVYDVVKEKRVTKPQAAKYAVSKRTASKKELRDHGIKE